MNDVFATMTKYFGGLFTSRFGTKPDEDWIKSFRGIEPEKIRCALNKITAGETEYIKYPPAILEFRALVHSDDNVKTKTSSHKDFVKKEKFVKTDRLDKIQKEEMAKILKILGKNKKENAGLLAAVERIQERYNSQPLLTEEKKEVTAPMVESREIKQTVTSSTRLVTDQKTDPRDGKGFESAINELEWDDIPY